MNVNQAKTRITTILNEKMLQPFSNTPLLIALCCDQAKLLSWEGCVKSRDPLGSSALRFSRNSEDKAAGLGFKRACLWARDPSIGDHHYGLIPYSFVKVPNVPNFTVEEAWTQ